MASSQARPCNEDAAEDFRSFACAFNFCCPQCNTTSVMELALASGPVNRSLTCAFNFSCPECNTTSVVELALACRPVNGPAVASPTSDAEGQKDSHDPVDAVLENGSAKATNVNKTGVSGSPEKDKTLLLASECNSMVPSSCDVVGGENSDGRATEPVFNVKRKSKNGEALELTFPDITPLFGLHLSDAAQKLGISKTSLKKACRFFGLHRWPGRKVRGLESTIEGLERQAADSVNIKVAGLRSEIPKLQQELNELCHGTPAHITEKMHSPADLTKSVYKHLYSQHGWRSGHRNRGRHDINTGNQPSLTSGIAPPSARKNSTGTTRADKAKKQLKRKPQLVNCTDDGTPENLTTTNADKKCARPSPRKYNIRPSPRRLLRARSRLGSRDTEMKASDLEGLLPEVHDIFNVAGREVPESVVQAHNGNNMTLREELLKRQLKGKAIVTCEGSMTVTKNDNNTTPNKEIGEEGIGDGKMALEEEGATDAEPSTKRPKTEPGTEPRCTNCGDLLLKEKLQGKAYAPAIVTCEGSMAVSKS